MYFVLEGSKEEIQKAKKATLLADGDFGVKIGNLRHERVGIFKHRLEVELNGPKERAQRCFDRIKSNYKILNQYD